MAAMNGNPQGPLPTTPGYLAERLGLPGASRDEFDQLVLWYRYYAELHHKTPFVSYKVLADLIRAGWRLSAAPLGERP